MRYRWTIKARPSQLPPPGDWRVWLILAGRGYGKTRVLSEWVRAQVSSGRCRRLAIVGRTAADARDVLVEGEAGILGVCPPWDRPKYEPSKRRLTWKNGARATMFAADTPDQLRGPEHDGAICDELATWLYGPEAFANLMLGLRIGADPRCVVATTPRPVKVLKELIKQRTTHLTTGTTYENIANLAPAFVEQIVQRYEGTRIGRQELYAQMLEDNPDALWKRDAMIEAFRVTALPELVRIVVAIDPAVTSGDDSDETGIVVAGRGRDGHLYVLDDLSLRGTPNQWASAAVAAYSKWHADRIIGEANQGGDMIEATIRTVSKNVSYKSVHAMRGKALRAEPIASLYEQGKGHHVGTFADMEDQLCSWAAGDKSPDRLDALVWAATELMINNQGWVRGAAA
jgi:phage terminase large subunit-like protein